MFDRACFLTKVCKFAKSKFHNCEVHNCGDTVQTFYSWRRELDKRDRERPAGTECLPTPDPAGSTGLVAVDVIGVLGETTLEITVAGGVLIRLREGVSAETLERVLAAACRRRAESVSLQRETPSSN